MIKLTKNKIRDIVKKQIRLTDLIVKRSSVKDRKQHYSLTLLFIKPNHYHV